MQQVEVLIEALAERRPGEFKLTWEEAHKRGPTWRKHLLDGMMRLKPHARDLMLKILGRPRKILPGLDLTFNNSPARHDSHREVISFDGVALGAPVPCAISREAMEDHFRADGLNKSGRFEAFQRNRSTIERLVREKYLTWPVEDLEGALIGTADAKTLLAQLKGP
ncbi:MAG: DUF1488 family protein [Steroidobacteraceae bacterium]